MEVSIPAIISVFSFFLTTHGFPNYLDRLPNGHEVRSPCKQESSLHWPGIGHFDRRGRGRLNDFGEDFERLGEVWNKEFCELDSDGDGRSNGEELGDPNCVWTPESNLRPSGAVTGHPGICEPLNDSKCLRRNKWLNCEPFDCPAFREPGMRSEEISLQNIQVVEGMNKRECLEKDLPGDREYHIVGVEPILSDNNDAVHDMVLYGCDQGKENLQVDLASCFNGVQDCATPIAAWGAQEPGQCYPLSFGIPAGQNGYKKLVLTINYDLRKQSTRSSKQITSGMRVYYTDNKRENSAQVLRVGQSYINLPPKKDEVEVEGKCDSVCTEKLKTEKIYITGGMIRMNKRGIAGKLEHYRNGHHQNDIVVDEHFKSGTPIIELLERPIEFKAGDELRLNCEYNTSLDINPIRHGETEGKEICAGFVTLYPPVENFAFCGQWKELPLCAINREARYKDCDFDTFKKLVFDLKYVEEHCMTNCTGVCKVILKGAAETLCYRGVLRDFVKEFLYKESAKATTVIFPAMDKCFQGMDIDKEELLSSTPGLTSNIALIALIALAFVSFWA